MQAFELLDRFLGPSLQRQALAVDGEAFTGERRPQGLKGLEGGIAFFAGEMGRGQGGGEVRTLGRQGPGALEMLQGHAVLLPLEGHFAEPVMAFGLARTGFDQGVEQAPPPAVQVIAGQGHFRQQHQGFARGGRFRIQSHGAPQGAFRLFASARPPLDPGRALEPQGLPFGRFHPRKGIVVRVPRGRSPPRPGGIGRKGGLPWG